MCFGVIRRIGHYEVSHRRKLLLVYRRRRLKLVY